ncbi:MAG: hypothetical protein MZW92_01365 [Comamonadaceae bacterium]|nr:hypothetical protein [Comamonadaceae bacterium]
MIKDRLGPHRRGRREHHARRSDGRDAGAVHRPADAVPRATASSRQAVDDAPGQGAAASSCSTRTTGEVLALANLPDYNPNNRAQR